MCESRISEPVLQFAIVGEQEKSFAIAIEPAGRINIFHRDVVAQRLPFAGKLAQHSERFIEKDVAISQGPDYTNGLCFEPAGSSPLELKIVEPFPFRAPQGSWPADLAFSA